MQAPRRAEFHPAKPGKVKLPTCGLRVGEKVYVRMPTCNHSVLITVKCGRACSANQLCVCEDLVMTFNAAGKCDLCTGAASDVAADAADAANASSAAASAASAASASDANSALEEPPSWWDSESDERFAECLYVAQMDGGYIEDRFYKQDTQLKLLFPTVGLAQWLHAKEWVQQQAKCGGIAARRHALGKSRRLRFIDLSTTRPARRRTWGAPDSSGAAWQTDDGARLYQDEDGCVTASSSSALPLTRVNANNQRLAAQQNIVTEGLMPASSSPSSSISYEGVYASGNGFGAELQTGGKRLRQDGFCSPLEAALERTQWLRGLQQGKERAPAASSTTSPPVEAAAGSPDELLPVRVRVRGVPTTARAKRPAKPPTEPPAVAAQGQEQLAAEALVNLQFGWTQR